MSKFSYTKVLGGAITGALLLTGCSAVSNGKGDDVVTIGIVQLDTSTIFANQEAEAQKVAYETLGWETVVTNSGGSPATAISAIQNFVQRGVDAIVVQTYTSDQITSGLAAAKKAGIPVFNTAGGEAGVDIAGAIDINLAEPINSLVVDEVKSGEPIELLTLVFESGTPCRVRNDDLLARLKDYPNVTITRQDVIVPGAQQQAQQATSGWLQAHPEKSGTKHIIWPCFADPAVGAVSAEKQLDRGPYSMYTWDLTGPSIEAIRDGSMNGVAWLDADKSGQAIADMIEEYFADPEGWDPRTEVGPHEVVTPDNLDAFLEKHPEVTAK